MRVKLTNRSKSTRERGGIATWTATDGRLIDHNGLLKNAHASDPFMSARLVFGSIKMALKSPHENAIHQRRFATARRTCDRSQTADRKYGGNMAEIVFVGIVDGEPVFGVGCRLF